MLKANFLWLHITALRQPEKDERGKERGEDKTKRVGGMEEENVVDERKRRKVKMVIRE